MRVLFQRREGYQRSVTTRSRQDLERNLTRQQNVNPLLETRVYTTEFHSGESIQIAANNVADSIFQNFDPDGNEFMLFKSIMDHKSTNKAAKYSDGYITCRNWSPQRREITKVWELLIEWANVMMTWEILSDIKESFSVQVLYYTQGNFIIKYP